MKSLLQKFPILLACIFIASCEMPSPTQTLTPAVSPTNTINAVRATQTPFIRQLEIYPDQPRQTINHIASGNFIHYFGDTTTATEAISEMNIKLLQPRFARLAIELDAWEPVNDNDDPLVMEKSAFTDGDHNHAAFELMKQFQEQGIELTASIWRVPDWLVDNPGDERNLVITRTMYAEAVESVAAWLLHAKEAYGVEVAYFSFNEANIGVNVLLSPEDYVEMIRIGGPRFKELGLKTKWLLGDCGSINGCLEYASAIWAAEDVRPYLGPLAYHNWDGTRAGDSTITALGNWAESQGLEARCTEGGWDPQLWQRSEEFSSWSNARQLARSYNRTLKMGRSTTFYYWEMMGRDYELNDGQQAFPSMEILIQLNELFPPGSTIVETSPNQGEVAFTAATTPDGGFSTHIINDGLSKTIRISGLPPGEYAFYTNTNGSLNQLTQTFGVGNEDNLTIDLPKFSVNYLVLK